MSRSSALETSRHREGGVCSGTVEGRETLALSMREDDGERKASERGGEAAQMDRALARSRCVPSMHAGDATWRGALPSFRSIPSTLGGLETTATSLASSRYVLFRGASTDDGEALLTTVRHVPSTQHEPQRASSYERSVRADLPLSRSRYVPSTKRVMQQMCGVKR